MNSKIAVAVICGALLVLALGGTRAANAAPPTDACWLLTRAQVSAVLGVTVGAGEKIMPNSAAMCGWEVPGQKSLDRKRVVVSIYTQIGSMTPVQRFNAAKTPIKGIPKEPVTGVGDDAVSVTTSGFGTGLIFRKGDSAFEVRVYGFPLDQVKAKEKALALDVLAKL
jgi:hypothetical protein